MGQEWTGNKIGRYVSLWIDNLQKVSDEGQKTKTSIKTFVRRVKFSDFGRKVMRTFISCGSLLCLFMSFSINTLKLSYKFKYLSKVKHLQSDRCLKESKKFVFKVLCTKKLTLSQTKAIIECCIIYWAIIRPFHPPSWLGWGRRGCWGEHRRRQ